MMQVVSELDHLLANRLPLYAGASEYAKNQYKSTLSSLNNIYATSEGRVEQAKKATTGLGNQALLICTQSADDLLDYVEEKLAMKIEEMEEKDRLKRVAKILEHLKEEFVLTPLHKVSELNGSLLEKGKNLGQQYILPMFITLKATVMVSRQIMLEVLGERLGQLKMTYKVSKDSVTMFFTGEFQEEKILARVGENINSIKQLTINFVQKGMEISVSKRELFQNYNSVVEKLTRIIQGVSTKSLEQWNDTKSKTLNLYHTVLNRIKEKEISIRTEYNAIAPATARALTSPAASEVSADLPEETTTAEVLSE